MIRVLLFGTLATRAGSRELQIEATGEINSVADILKRLEDDYPGTAEGVYMYAVNETQAELETQVKDGDEVAVMPPFSGG